MYIALLLVLLTPVRPHHRTKEVVCTVGVKHDRRHMNGGTWRARKVPMKVAVVLVRERGVTPMRAKTDDREGGANRVAAVVVPAEA